jgi:hypothetical protein
LTRELALAKKLITRNDGKGIQITEEMASESGIEDEESSRNLMIPI